MQWIMIGVLSGSLVTAMFSTREACEGHAVLMREAKVAAKCVEMPSTQPFSTGMYFNGIAPNAR